MPERQSPADPRGRLVIAVDGPGGAGKSTVSRAIASRLGLRYLDTGAMYRAVTWAVLERSLDPHDEVRVAELARSLDLEVGTDPADPWTRVDGRDVTTPIRTREVTNAVSAVSAVPAVREHLVALQRTIIGAGGIVVEGRDIGTTVAPDADAKIFLTASPEARARRRQQDVAAPDAAAVDVTLAEIERRDHRDSSRAASPLVRAADAVEIDATELGIHEVVAAILARFGLGGGAPVAAASRPQRAGNG